MFYLKEPSSLDKPWFLSKRGDEKAVFIPREISKFLKNYHVMAIEFLYHNYRRGVQGSILNEEPGMNYPLQISALLRAIADSSSIILVICPQKSLYYWHYHLTEHANFKVLHYTEKNSVNLKVESAPLVLLLDISRLKLCENLDNIDFFAVVIEDFEQIANKVLVRKLRGRFNVGLTCRSFYTDPDQKLQWKMLNWANLGCVGKLNDFYEVDNRNFENFQDNYRHWWLRLTWNFCESFKKPTDEELQTYEQTVLEWATENGFDIPNISENKPRKRKSKPKQETESQSKNCSETKINEVPMEKYVKLPSMDENPILTSIIKNFEISSEPIETCTKTPTLIQPTCSKNFEEDNSIILSFIDRNKEIPSTSKCDSGTFILDLIQKSDTNQKNETKPQDINDILKEVDAVLQN